MYVRHCHSLIVWRVGLSFQCIPVGQYEHPNSPGFNHLSIVSTYNYQTFLNIVLLMIMQPHAVACSPLLLRGCLWGTAPVNRTDNRTDTNILPETPFPNCLTNRKMHQNRTGAQLDCGLRNNVLLYVVHTYGVEHRLKLYLAFVQDSMCVFIS